MGVRYGYMCKVDYDFELGEALGGNVIYPSVANLKHHKACTKECGIVRVRISLDKVIQEEDYIGLKDLSELED